ncbi:hypothetical protein [Nocardia sp. NPDC004711]
MNGDVDRTSMDASGSARHLGPGTQLKALLKERHWQTHSAFRREYNKAAVKVDRSLVGLAPGKAQFYKWLAGDLKGLPYPDHCAVLEAMLPGYTVEEMFAPAGPPRTARRLEQDRPATAAPASAGDSRRSSGVAGVPDRADRVVGHSGESNESRDPVVGFERSRVLADGVPFGTPASRVPADEDRAELVQPQQRSQAEVTAAIDARVRSLMSWIGDTAPIKERDLHARPSESRPAARDRRMSR